MSEFLSENFQFLVVKKFNTFESFTVHWFWPKLFTRDKRRDGSCCQRAILSSVQRHTHDKNMYTLVIRDHYAATYKIFNAK